MTQNVPFPAVPRDGERAEEYNKLAECLERSTQLWSRRVDRRYKRLRGLLILVSAATLLCAAAVVPVIVFAGSIVATVVCVVIGLIYALMMLLMSPFFREWQRLGRPGDIETRLHEGTGQLLSGYMLHNYPELGRLGVEWAVKSAYDNLRGPSVYVTGSIALQPDLRISIVASQTQGKFRMSVQGGGRQQFESDTGQPDKVLRWLDQEFQHYGAGLAARVDREQQALRWAERILGEARVQLQTFGKSTELFRAATARIPQRTGNEAS